MAINTGKFTGELDQKWRELQAARAAKGKIKLREIQQAEGAIQGMRRILGEERFVENNDDDAAEREMKVIRGLVTKALE